MKHPNRDVRLLSRWRLQYEACLALSWPEFRERVLPPRPRTWGPREDRWQLLKARVREAWRRA